ncbi:hypothetical protein ACTL6P_13215 [Endozoicomonas acroporae]|uniref:hypothetical protein n=1 Tax=Endozoicomonas acroporae TaxID=1701104 RepID=UPI000C79101C|nr:hypothetical protein [Endozoicomonas acroporae]
MIPYGQLLNQLNTESHPALYQQFSVASAVPEVQILTNVSKETSFAQSSNLFTHMNRYGLKTITPEDTAVFIGTDDLEIPESVLNQYFPLSSSDKPEDETLSLIPTLD